MVIVAAPGSVGSELRAAIIQRYSPDVWTPTVSDLNDSKWLEKQLSSKPMMDALICCLNIGPPSNPPWAFGTPVEPLSKVKFGWQIDLVERAYNLMHIRRCLITLTSGPVRAGEVEDSIANAALEAFVMSAPKSLHKDVCLNVVRTPPAGTLSKDKIVDRYLNAIKQSETGRVIDR